MYISDSGETVIPQNMEKTEIVNEIKITNLKKKKVLICKHFANLLLQNEKSETYSNSTCKSTKNVKI